MPVAAHAAQAHAVAAQVLHPGLGDVGHHVGCEIGHGVVHLVEQLLGDGVAVDPATGAGWLADGATAVGAQVGNGIAEVGEAGHVLEAGVGEIAAGDLGAAFQQVAGHGGAGQPVPVVQCPAEVGQGRPQGERGVGHAAGDHDVGAGAQGLGDGGRTDVGVGADHGPSAQRLAHLGHQRVAPTGSGHVVAFDDGHARARQAQFAGQGMDAPRRRARVGRAHVADDAHAVPQAAREHRRQQLVQQRLVALLRVVAPRQLGQRQGALGQSFEDQAGRGAAADQFIDHRAGGVGPVAGEAGGGTDAQGV